MGDGSGALAVSAAGSAQTGSSPDGGPHRSRSARDLVPRVVSALVAAPVALAATFLGGAWFAALVLVSAALAVWEITALAVRARLPGSWPVGLASAVALPLSAALMDVRPAWLAFGFALGVGAWSSIRSGGQLPVLLGWAVSVAGGLYVGALLAPTIALRSLPDGLEWVLLILACTWGCDITAFLVGRQWGRHRLAPRVSPNKSVEGVVGGVVAAVVIAGAASLMVGQPLARLVGFGVLLGLGAVVGDLAESALKRQLDTKDSGWIMPGHGGMLDRIDSLLFTGFLGYWYVVITDRIWQS
ncbi:MAG: CDP-diglyceride synthetase [Chloroflexi bacterium]|nr:CDP-diglyceride synthetase [Chloroflexota bacterium]